MSVRMPMLFGLIALIASVPIAISAKRFSRVESHLIAAMSNLDQIKTDAIRINELRSKQQMIAEQKRPDQDVIARVNAMLSEAELPLNSFGGLRPEADAELPNSFAGSVTYRRQSVRISINELTIREIGDFVSRWCSTQPLWVLTRIELTHSRNGKNADRYDLSLLLSATYVAQRNPDATERP